MVVATLVLALCPARGWVNPSEWQQISLPHRAQVMSLPATYPLAPVDFADNHLNAAVSVKIRWGK